VAEMTAGHRYLMILAGVALLGLSLVGSPAPACSGTAGDANAEAFVVWARDHAVAIASADLGAPLADLAPVKAMVGDARVVLLGQANRDAHEELQMGCRLVRFLVEKMGFTVLALEEGLASSRDINAYLARGEGEPAALVAGMSAWQTWDTEEFLALLKWLRAYNRNPAHKQKVRFYGIDITGPDRALADVMTYLDRVDPEYATFLRRGPVDLGFFKADSWRQVAARYTRMGDARRYGVDGYLKDLLARFEARRAEYVALSSEAEYAWARREAVSVERANGFFGAAVNGTPEEAANVRITAMVDNLLWVVDEAAKGERIVVWAHNVHASREHIGVMAAGANEPVSIYPLGKFLSVQMGAGLVSFGFSSNRADYPDEPLPPAPASSADGVLARVGKPMFVIDLRAAPATGPVRDWLSTRNAIRGLGGETRLVPGEAYDALVFIDTVTPARSTAGAIARLATLDLTKFSTRYAY
jgi:erythromycin esterase